MALVFGLRGIGLVCHVSPTCTTQASFPALPQLAHPMQPDARGGVSSPVLRSSVLDYLHSHHQGELYEFSQVRIRTLSPSCCREDTKLFCFHFYGTGYLHYQ